MPQEISFTLNGALVTAKQGDTLAAAIANTSQSGYRTSVSGQPRGPLCGMGVCFECVVTVDGQPNVRSCQLPVRLAMKVETE